MATLTFTMKYTAVVSGKGATATCPVTLNYTTSSNNTTFTMTTTSFTVGAVSASGDTRAQGQARMGIINALASGGAECLFNGAQVFKRTDLNPSTTYTASYSRSINRTTANQSIPLQFKGTYGSRVENLSVPARTSYDVTYNANSGSGAPATQKKYYDYNLTLSSGRPTKVDHTFLGWATSTTIAGAGTVNYNPSQTYTANAGLNLYAVWERNYQKPTLGNLHIDRCQQDGTLDDDGTYAKVSFDWGVFRTADARYYGGSTTPYADNAVDTCTVTVGTQSATPTLTGQSGTASVIVGNGTFDTDQAYTASVSITDTQTIKSDHTITITGELSKAKFPIDINSTATAIAFLSTAPDDDEGVFCPDMTAQEVQDFVDNLEGGGGSGTADRVIEQGTSGIWTYRKWNSGIAECWGYTAVPSATYSANGGYKQVAEAVPSIFNTTPITVHASGYIATLVQTSIGYTAVDSSWIQTYLINRSASAVTNSGRVYWELKGTWK